MAEEDWDDVEAMLEAPYRKDTDGDKSSPGQHNHESRSKENGRKQYSRSRSKERSASRDRGKENDYYRNDRAKAHGPSRDRDRERVEREQGRYREKDPRKSRDGDRGDRADRGEREHDRERERDRERDRRRSKSRDRRRSRSRDKRRSRSRDKRRSRSRDRRRSPPRDRRRSRSKERRERSVERKREKVREPKRSRSRDRRRRSPSPRPFRRGRTPPNGLGDRSPPEDLSPEERDARTVFCMQLSQRIRARDLEEFFSSVGKVRDVRLITCNKTKRFKGIAYIEFKDPESVALALGLSGQRLLGIPISVQHTQAEKNRMANSVPTFTPKNHTGPMRLYVGSLHFNITEDMLRGIFEPFGKIDNIQLIMDQETGRSKGYGFITYHNADDAKKALEQLNGFELAGRPMKVGNVTERLDMNTTSLDTDEMDRSGIDLGATGRLQLMFKLAEGAGLAVPQAAANALLATAPQPAPVQQPQPAPTIATQCFMLSNMFDPATESNPNWDTEIEDDVIDECKKHGGILHVYVDKESQGNVDSYQFVKYNEEIVIFWEVEVEGNRRFRGDFISSYFSHFTSF
ncbi:unnamed protein product [Hermetia illucens]|uniref:RRM domain-containing protein n=1 Tax=Hermetia illucens TaxID=343691 RepID=A0A7R8YN69_HERIL|nr:unnamed protein product [Hermetia illucens]